MYKNENTIWNNYIVNDKIIVSQYFSAKSPPILSLESEAILPIGKYLSTKYSYTTFFKNYSIFLTRRFLNQENVYAFLSYPDKNMLVSLYDDNGFGGFFTFDKNNPLTDYRSVEYIRIEQNKIVCKSENLVKTDVKIYDRKQIDFNIKDCDKFYEYSLLYDSIKDDKAKIKTFSDLNKFFQGLNASSEYCAVKKSILQAGALAKELNGAWALSSLDANAAMNCFIIADTNAIFLSDSISTSCDLFNNNSLSNFNEIRLGKNYKDLISKSEFKLPYMSLSYDIFTKKIILHRGYEYVIKDGEKYTYIRENSGYFLTQNSNDELLFEGFTFYNDKNGNVKSKPVYLKWKFSSDKNEIVEYYKFDKEWIFNFEISRIQK